jgi:glycolate oxidase
LFRRSGAVSFAKKAGERKVDSAIKQQLMDIVGRESFTDLLIDLVSYSYDASDHSHRPEAAVWPSHSEQISKILALANEHRFPVTPRGAGTGLAGSAIPSSGGLILDLCRMNKIIDIRIPDRLAIVQPGVVYADLEKALAPFGFFYPPDPASASVCTLGGNVATNAGGIRGAKYGVTKDYVMGLEVVLPDGRILRSGSGCMKSASGYDLTRLIVGSEGTLAVITEITLKIVPKPTSVKTGLASFAQLEDASRSFLDIIHSGIVPSALEVLDVHTIRVLRETGGMDLPDAMAMILVETDGCTDEEASFQMTKVTEAFKRNRPLEIQVATSLPEAEQLWRIRKSAGSVAARLRPNNVSEDVTVPISKVPALMTGISAIVRKVGLPFVIFGHAGDGNLHPRIMYDRSDPDQVKMLDQTLEEIFRLTCQLGGTITGEHGVGLAKAPYMAFEHDPVALDMMRAIKRLFDPHNILNPGKMALEGPNAGEVRI